MAEASPWTLQEAHSAPLGWIGAKEKGREGGWIAQKGREGGGKEDKVRK